jgi:hypothetical protein
MSQTRTLRQKDKKKPPRPSEKSVPPPPSLPALAKLLPSEGNVTLPAMLFHHWEARHKQEEAQHKQEMAMLDKVGLAINDMGRAAVRRIQELEQRVAALEQQRQGGAPRAARPRKKK